MDMGSAPTWLRQVSPTPASQNHFNHWPDVYTRHTSDRQTDVRQHHRLMPRLGDGA